MHHRLLVTLAAAIASAPLAAQMVEGLDWSLRDDGGAMTLAWEVPETDDVRFGLSCERGSGRVTLWSYPAADARPEFRLSSGGVDATYPATLETEDLPYLSTEVPADEPVLQRFLGSGELTLVGDGWTERMDATPPQRDRIGRFFRHCG